MKYKITLCLAAVAATISPVLHDEMQMRAERAALREKICGDATATLGAVAPDPAVAATVRMALATEIDELPNADWAPGYCRAVADNLARKVISRGEGVAFDAPALIQTSLKYEAFRIASFRNSGVSPKLYSGFVDGLGTTAAFERQLLQISARVAPLLNAYAQKHNMPIRVTPKEIAVTHMAEGGALLLTTRFTRVDTVDPIGGIGLDDYRIGFHRYPDLTGEIDRSFGTKIGSLKGDKTDVLNFTESVLGTAIMYLYEKDLTEQKLLAEKRPSLATMPLDEQFVIASLVYNSGILFSQERMRQIMAFDTADYLVETSERNADKRPRLPVQTPGDADALLARGEALPVQNTSWSAVYHILQRYGAWVALNRFTDAFSPDGEVKPEFR